MRTHNPNALSLAASWQLQQTYNGCLVTLLSFLTSATDLWRLLPSYTVGYQPFQCTSKKTKNPLPDSQDTINEVSKCFRGSEMS